MEVWEGERLLAVVLWTARWVISAIRGMKRDFLLL
jgi:hypothetical protein